MKRGMKTARNIERFAKAHGIVISVQPATNWHASGQKATQWLGGHADSAHKMWAYSILDPGYGAWIEPGNAYASLRELKEALEAHIDGREF